VFLRLATDHKYAFFKSCAMLGIAQVESRGMSLGFFFSFLRVVVGELVANIMVQGIKVLREHVNLEEMQVKRRMVDNLL
jgi:hypothetical protein